jgi:hypothetical protein
MNLITAYWSMKNSKEACDSDIFTSQHLRGFLLNWLTLEGWSDRLSRDVGNYQSTLRNIPEERRSQVTI